MLCVQVEIVHDLKLLNEKCMYKIKLIFSKNKNPQTRIVDPKLRHTVLITTLFFFSIFLLLIRPSNKFVFILLSNQQYISIVTLILAKETVKNSLKNSKSIVT